MNNPAHWSYTPAVALTARRGLADRWVAVFLVALVGYALFGRGFAYIGAPPLFISEALLGTGLVLVVFGRQTRRIFPTLPLKLIAVLLVWVAVRTVPYLGTYGVDAVRDAMVVGYGLFAMVVVALLLERPERLVEGLREYRVLAFSMLGLGWWLFLLFRLRPELFPTWPWAPEVSVVYNKPGDVLVHLAGVTAFFVLGFRRVGIGTLTLLVVAVGAVMVGSRGGTVGYLLGITTLAILKPRRATFGRMAYVGAVVIALALAVPTSSVELDEGGRSLSIEQLWENAKSVVGQSDEFGLNTTTQWRSEWWSKIIGYTFGGEYFLDGKGFGRNLASEDGFQVDAEDSLRSPHNAHLTLLARGGVPAFVLWALIHGLWVGYVFAAWWRARLARQEGWMSVFAFLATYWVAAQVNASFDVYLEGPMGAIWFWAVFGAGIAATLLQRSHPHLPDTLFAQADAASVPARPWHALNGTMPEHRPPSSRSVTFPESTSAPS